MLEKVLIANRGEIALRVLRSCKELGIKTVAVHSTADRDLMHVRLSDESVCIGPPSPADSYLNTPAIQLCDGSVCADAAASPGSVARGERRLRRARERVAMAAAGLVPAIGRERGGQREVMRAAGVPTVPGSNGPIDDNNERTLSLAKEIGYPVIIKATAGGGGRGMRPIYSEAALLKAIFVTQTEAKSFFGNGVVYLEKFLENPRHVEIQVIGDGKGNALYLGDRDCSLQRRHQKVLEEAPAPGIPDKVRAKVAQTCIQACKNMNYRGAGTLEFLYEDEAFYFIEMNTRVQVEHPVTEMITGVDIVKEQLLIAGGAPLSYVQEDIHFRGHAFECRINAEDPVTFMPSPGKIKMFHAPGGNGVRVDSHLYSGYNVPPHYDSLIAKLICHANTREAALKRTQIALDEMLIDGIRCNIPLHQDLVRDAEFHKGCVNIHYLEKKLGS